MTAGLRYLNGLIRVQAARCGQDHEVGSGGFEKAAKIAVALRIGACNSLGKGSGVDVADVDQVQLV